MARAIPSALPRATFTSPRLLFRDRYSSSDVLLHSRTYPAQRVSANSHLQMYSACVCVSVAGVLHPCNTTHTHTFFKKFQKTPLQSQNNMLLYIGPPQTGVNNYTIFCLGEKVMDENVMVQNNVEDEKKRFYTHCIVSYASLEELQPLLSQAKHYAYVFHFKCVEDNSPAPHYHIIATFEREKSFAWVRKQVKSTQNTFTELPKGDVEDVLTYFTHENEPDKGQYIDSIVYDDYEYWKRRARTGDKEENKNDTFVDDLIAPDFSIEKMSRKYGRDFIKNHKAYIEARKAILFERGEHDLLIEAKEQQALIESATRVCDLYTSDLKG